VRWGRERFEIFVGQVGKRVASGGRLAADVMQRISIANPDLFVRNLEEGTAAGRQTAPHDMKSRAPDVAGEPPEHSPAGREEVGDV
jgi:hypothetical protein